MRVERLSTSRMQLFEMCCPIHRFLAHERRSSAALRSACLGPADIEDDYVKNRNAHRHHQQHDNSGECPGATRVSPVKAEEMQSTNK